VGEKTLTRLASGFVCLLANPEFYSHLASWQVVIRTPELDYFSKHIQLVECEIHYDRIILCTPLFVFSAEAERSGDVHHVSVPSVQQGVGVVEDFSLQLPEPVHR
jgi:hypothetical protein